MELASLKHVIDATKGFTLSLAYHNEGLVNVKRLGFQQESGSEEESLIIYSDSGVIAVDLSKVVLDRVNPYVYSFKIPTVGLLIIHKLVPLTNLSLTYITLLDAFPIVAMSTANGYASFHIWNRTQLELNMGSRVCSHYIADLTADEDELNEVLDKIRKGSLSSPYLK